MADSMTSPLDVHDARGDQIGDRPPVNRDAPVPIPLAGNNERKTIAELDSIESPPGLRLNDGANGSNHSRTFDLFAAQRRIRLHFVLPGETNNRGFAQRSPQNRVPRAVAIVQRPLIGAKAVALLGSRNGDDAGLGAGTAVKRSAYPSTIVMGAPAR